MTLVELSVVIIVLFTFVSTLFVGARAWKRGSDRAGCIVNIREVQVSVRGYANANDLEVGDYLTLLGTAGTAEDAIVGPDSYMEALPGCPQLGLYTINGNRVPPVGTLYMTCSLAGFDAHVPEYFSTW